MADLARKNSKRTRKKRLFTPTCLYFRMKVNQNSGFTQNKQITKIFIIQVKKTGVSEWSWSRGKQSGMKPSERISSSMIAISDDSAILFGGVYDNQVVFMFIWFIYNLSKLIFVSFERTRITKMRTLRATRRSSMIFIN